MASLGARAVVWTRTGLGAPPAARAWSSATTAAVVALRSILRPTELATTPTILPERLTRYWADFAGRFTAFAAFLRLAGICDSSSSTVKVPPAAGANRSHERTSAALIFHVFDFVAILIVFAIRTAWSRASNTAASSTRGRVVVVPTGITTSPLVEGSRAAARACSTAGAASASRPVRARVMTTPFGPIVMVALVG